MFLPTMAFIPALFSTTAHVSLQTAATTSMTTLMASAVKDFFLNIFLHPGENSTAIMVLCGVTIAACVGLAFLVKKVYEKFCPERT